MPQITLTLLFITYLPLVVLVIILGAVAIILKVKLDAWKSNELYKLGNEKAFIKQNQFLSDSEERFYKELTKVLPYGYYCFPQVNLRSILKVDMEKGDAYERLEILEKWIVDYVIFDKENLSPILVLEQNDATHKWFKRKSRDEWVKRALENAGIPMYNFTANHYTFSRDIEKILQLISTHNR